MNKTIKIIFISAIAVLTLICLILLPDNVATQLGVNMQKQNIMPKQLAICIPLVLSIIGITGIYKNAGNKFTVIYCAGIFSYIMLLAVNI